MAKQRLIVFSNPVAGQETGYIDWYKNQHLGDVVAVPGVIDGQFFTATPDNAKWRHLAVYTVEAGKLGEVMASIAQRINTDKMPKTDTIDTAATVFLSAEVIGDASGSLPTDASLRLVALTAPLDGQQAELDSWYEKQHVPDVLDTPGFLGAERLTLLSKRGGNPDWTRMGLYWANGDDGKSLMRGLRDRGAAGKLPMSPAMDNEKSYIAVYQVTSELAKH